MKKKVELLFIVAIMYYEYECNKKYYDNYFISVGE